MKEYQNEEWLKEAYKKYKYNTKIAEICNVSDDTIEYWRKKFNIKRNKNYKSGARKHFFDENYFKIINTEEKAYWLGFIMADGCVMKDGSQTENRLILCLKKDDINHLYKFQKAIKSNYKIETKTVSRKHYISETCQIRISSKKMCSDLKKLNIFVKKTGHESIPNIKEDLIKHFIRGFFDGDGSIFGTLDNYYRLNFCSASLKILTEITEYFKTKLNIKLSIYDESHLYKNNFYKIESNKVSTNKKLLSHIYDNPKVFLDRKYERVISFLNCPHK